MIAAENLVKDYGAIRAVDGVSFSVSPGEILGFLGPNGAGKSTTMKILSGYLPATSGDATVAGFDVATQSLDVRQNLGYLPEHNALYTDMLVSEYLRFVGAMRGIPGPQRRGKVDEVVVTCDLQEYYYRPIGTLSKGFRQRVGLASAMIHDPAVLIFDEPTSGLDPVEIKKIRELIRMLGKTKTVILSTHILQEVAATCDRVIIIARGGIIADGTPDSICRQAGGKRRLRVGLIGDGDADTLLGRIDGVTAVEEQPHDGARRRYLLQLEDDAHLEAGLAELVTEHGFQLSEIVPMSISLEEAFETLVLASEERRGGGTPAAAAAATASATAPAGEAGEAEE